MKSADWGAACVLSPGAANSGPGKRNLFSRRRGCAREGIEGQSRHCVSNCEPCYQTLLCAGEDDGEHGGSTGAWMIHIFYMGRLRESRANHSAGLSIGLDANEHPKRPLQRACRGKPWESQTRRARPWCAPGVDRRSLSSTREVAQHGYAQSV